ncbi:MarR family transcriptional regulator [Catenulispora sp. NL8]|uniref:MarR family transcriptional regulator n=1 Tax=Catenulispora pinistramenti TaxID=2705254 RepID=A0ABS5KKY0_9ACTN|nr:MarR family transcriptional regulator [Catenulispora pinistramenti]MBS2546698.1 MarR family transcriptional regulator [Catenulispora pinistramenti]
MSAQRPDSAPLPQSLDNLGLLMAVTFRTIVDRHAAVLAERGHGWLRPSHAYVLHALEEQPRSIKELSEFNQVSKQAMSQIVDQLQERALVSRSIDPTDRRARAIQITEQGQQTLVQAASAWAAVEEEVRTTVGERDLATTMRTMRRYLESEPHGAKDSTKLSRVW